MQRKEDLGRTFVLLPEESVDEVDEVEVEVAMEQVNPLLKVEKELRG